MGHYLRTTGFDGADTAGDTRSVYAVDQSESC